MLKFKFLLSAKNQPSVQRQDEEQQLFIQTAERSKQIPKTRPNALLQL